MFPFSLKTTLSVTFPSEKALFAAELANSLVSKFNFGEITENENGYLIRFSGGFARLPFKLKSIDGTIQIDNREEKITYEVFHTSTFVMLCIVLFSILVLLREDLNWLVVLLVTGAVGLLYFLTMGLISLLFHSRISQSVQDVKLMYVSITDQQLGWI